MQKNNLHYFLRTFTLTIVVGIFFVTNLFLPTANGQSDIVEQANTEISTLNNQITDNVLPLTQSTQILETAVFKTDDQSSVLVRPTFNDDSTNIAFYMKCPSEACPNDGTLESPVFIFSAENLGHGILPFSEYWTPPFPSDYIAIEYKNDAQQFSCSSISFDECLADPRFIKIFHFSLVENDTNITPEMLAIKSTLNNPATDLETSLASSTASVDLLLLSITLSSTSISSNLDNGLIVTASLDGIASVAISSVFATDTATSVETENIQSTSTEDNEGPSVGSFIMDIIENVIDIFTPEETPEVEPSPMETEPAPTVPMPDETSGIELTPDELISPEPEESLPEPMVENTPAEPASEDEVQSSVSTDDETNNETITTEF